MTGRHIPVLDVAIALTGGWAEMIEDYPDDPRGPSCLILGFTARGQPLHIQCTYPPQIAIITAYEPDPQEWRQWRIRLEDPA